MALWRRFGGAQPPTFSPRKTRQSQYDHAKTHLHRAADSVLRLLRSPRSPVPSFSVGIAIKKTRKPEVNQESRITAPTIRERATSDHDPRRNRNETSRKPSCLAHRRQTAGVIERTTFREERMMGANKHTTFRKERMMGANKHTTFRKERMMGANKHTTFR